jgi:hypothetical protein
MMGCTVFSHCKRLGDDGLWDWNGINELFGWHRNVGRGAHWINYAFGNESWKLQRIISNILEDRGCTGGVESCRDAATMHEDGDSLNFNALH